MKNEEPKSEYEEPEIVSNNQPRSHGDPLNDFKDFAAKFAGEEINGVKKKVLFSSLGTLFLAGLVVFGVLGIIVWLLSFVLPALFTIFVAVFLFGGISYLVYTAYRFVTTTFKK